VGAFFLKKVCGGSEISHPNSKNDLKTVTLWFMVLYYDL
jgi:hypothetical protein